MAGEPRPLTVDELAALKSWHKRDEHITSRCYMNEDRWPCMIARLIATAEAALRAAPEPRPDLREAAERYLSVLDKIAVMDEAADDEWKATGTDYFDSDENRDRGDALDAARIAAEEGLRAALTSTEGGPK